MNLTRFVEGFLVRDVFSYLIPGILIVIILTGFGFDNGITQLISSTSETTFGDTGVILVYVGIEYIIGYLASTILCYSANIFYPLYSSKISKPAVEILDALKCVFGDWVMNAKHDYLAEICSNYVELRNPNYYFEKIDRLVLLRDLEIGIASVLATLSISFFVGSPGQLKLWGLVPLGGTILLMFSASVVHSDMLRQSFIAFYATVQIDKLKNSKSK